MRNEIEELSKFLTQWRASHRAPTRLPQEVWRKAAVIAAHHGPTATAKELRLDYRVLKRKMVEARMPQGVEFVEILPTAHTPPPVLDCVVEVQSSSGARLRVEARNLPVTELTAMVREFRG
jgi:hypothetical protein